MKSKTCAYLALCLLIVIPIAGVLDVEANAGHQDQAELSNRSITTTSVNDKNPFGIRIVSGTTVETGSATGGLLVNLGKLGRVQLSKRSKIKLSYDENFVTGSLYSGKVLVAAPAGVSVKISTVDGDVLVNGGTATSLTIDIECGNTHVKVKNGEVELRAGGKVKKVPFGTENSIGKPQPSKKCAR